MTRIVGIRAAPGLAAGRLVRLGVPARAARARGTPGAESAALEAAIAAARGQLGQLAAAAGHVAASEILAFQIEMLDDSVLTAPALEAIEAGKAAEAAWQQTLDAEIADYESSSDAYFRARAADLRDLRERVLDRLCGAREGRIPPASIVVAEDLAPSRFLAADWNGGGIVLHRGSATSHVAILARARGVPMLVGVNPALFDGQVDALLDAEEGVLVLDPNERERAQFDARRAEYASRRAAESAHLSREARTAAGERVRVMVNITGPQDLDYVDPEHTDGIGLVRTEFLFQEREQLPGEEEQYAAYRAILEWARGRPVTIRTVDAGGDKPVKGLTRDGEANPFLGLRGLRLSLARPEIFRVQLRALARAGVHGKLKVMLPMVTTPDELARARLILEQVLAELGEHKVARARPALGIMVEVPAAALEIDRFDADFYSVGSNDLIQYLNAASRDEPELAPLARPSPALWRLLRECCEHARASSREISVCGDLASDARYVPALLDCGLRALSVAPAALASVKTAIARHGWRA